MQAAGAEWTIDCRGKTSAQRRSSDVGSTSKGVTDAESVRRPTSTETLSKLDSWSAVRWHCSRCSCRWLTSNRLAIGSRVVHCHCWWLQRTGDYRIAVVAFNARYWCCSLTSDHQIQRIIRFNETDFPISLNGDKNLPIRLFLSAHAMYGTRGSRSPTPSYLIWCFFNTLKLRNSSCPRTEISLSFIRLAIYGFITLRPVGCTPPPAPVTAHQLPISRMLHSSTHSQPRPLKSIFLHNPLENTGKILNHSLQMICLMHSVDKTKWSTEYKCLCILWVETIYHWSPKIAVS